MAFISAVSTVKLAIPSHQKQNFEPTFVKSFLIFIFVGGRHSSVVLWAPGSNPQHAFSIHNVEIETLIVIGLRKGRK